MSALQSGPFKNYKQYNKIPGFSTKPVILSYQSDDNRHNIINLKKKKTTLKQSRIDDLPDSL